MVLSWIHINLSPHIVQSTIFFDSTFDLWDNLHGRFTKGKHFFCFSDLLCDLYPIKQGDISLSHYFNDLKILWGDLEYLRPTPSCLCPIPCTCDLAKAIQNYKHMEYVSCFLKDLNKNYQNIHTKILLLDPIPNISSVYSLIVQ